MSKPTCDRDVLQYIPEQLAKTGYCHITHALPQAITQHLFQRVTALHPSDFTSAGIGRQHSPQHQQAFRTDHIHWLEQANPAEDAYLVWMESLRLAVNRHLFMGLFSYEAHFSHYAPNAFYKRHMDAFQGNSNRMLTTVFYLNPTWAAADGGALLVYAPDSQAPQPPIHHVTPLMGSLVVFLSDQFPHEVCQAHRDRYSIAGWFKLAGT